MLDPRVFWDMDTFPLLPCTSPLRHQTDMNSVIEYQSLECYAFCIDISSGKISCRYFQFCIGARENPGPSVGKGREQKRR